MMWWSRLWRRNKMEKDLGRELEFHIAERIAALKSTGLSEAEARRRVRHEFGGIEQVKEECRDARNLNMLDDLGRDLRYSARMLRKSPVFAGVAILSLALGIGANASIFSLIDALLLRPLPVPDSDRLVTLLLDSANGRPQSYLTYAVFREIAKQKQIFSGVFTWAGHQFQIRSSGEMTHVDGVLASGEYFSTLGVQPEMGRTLTPEDDQPGGGRAGPVAVISDAFWSHQFRRDPSAIGSDLLLDGVHFTIVGVMPPGFFGAEAGTQPNIWVPIGMSPRIGSGACINSKSCWWLIVMGRRRPDVSLKQAQSALRVTSPQFLKESLPTSWHGFSQNKSSRVQLIAVAGANGWTGLRRQFRNPLAILMTLVGVVLLIACANLANLLVARASTRYREIAVRLAMGAGRWRVIRQLLTESFLLCGIGAGLGLAFAQFSTRALIAFLDAKGTGFGAPGFGESAAFDLRPDWRVICFTVVAAVTSGLLFGLLPALRATRVGISASLKERARSLRGGDERRASMGRWLLALQVALSILLVAGAGLFAGSLFRLLTLNIGFDPNDVTVIGVDTEKRSDKGMALIGLYSRLLGRVNAMPGVRAASLLCFVPLSDSGWDDYLEVPGKNDIPKEQRLADINLVGPRFFEVMGMPLIAGRDFQNEDNSSSEKVSIINELTARTLFPNRDPIGEHVVLEKTTSRIIGVVGNAKYLNVREPDPLALYFPYAQATEGLPSLSFVIKTKGKVAIYPDFRAVLQEIAPDVPIGIVKTMQKQLEDSLGRDRLMATLSVFFGVLALVLTAIGLYGILGYTVVQRTGEIGVRMALGAQQRDVLLLVLREAIGLVVIGIAAGIVVVLAVSRLISSFLYGIAPNDPGNLVLAVLVLITTASLAAYLPARRASHLDPMLALREE